MDFNAPKYTEKLDKKAVLIAIIYVWLLIISTFMMKDYISTEYNAFVKDVVIPNLVKGQDMYIKDKNESK